MKSVNHDLMKLEIIGRKYVCTIDEACTKLRMVFMLKRTTHDKPEFNCGRRAENFGMGYQPKAEEVLDGWNLQKDGTRTCSYCGSLSEEDFIDICEHYAAGDAGYHLGSTDKSYKFYANRPGVGNAMDGGIKFYIAHVDRSDHLSLEARAKIVELAVRTESKNWQMRNMPNGESPKGQN